MKREETDDCMYKVESNVGENKQIKNQCEDIVYGCWSDTRLLF